MTIVKNMIAKNEVVSSGNSFIKFNTVLDVSSGNFGYNNIKLVVSANGAMPVGTTLDVYVLKDNLGALEKITLTTPSIANSMSVIESAIEKVHLSDRIKCVLKVPRGLTDYKFTAMVQLNDVADNILGGTHEMFMVKREF